MGIFRADRRGVLLVSIAGDRQRRQVGIGEHLTVVVPGARVVGDRHPHQPGYLSDHILRDIQPRELVLGPPGAAFLVIGKTLIDRVVVPRRQPDGIGVIGIDRKFLDAGEDVAQVVHTVVAPVRFGPVGQQSPADAQRSRISGMPADQSRPRFHQVPHSSYGARSRGLAHVSSLRWPKSLRRPH